MCQKVLCLVASRFHEERRLGAAQDETWSPPRNRAAALDPAESRDGSDDVSVESGKSVWLQRPVQGSEMRRREEAVMYLRSDVCAWCQRNSRVFSSEDRLSLWAAVADGARWVVDFESEERALLAAGVAGFRLR